MSDDKVIYMVQKSKIQPEDLETVELALREAQSQYLQLIDELPAGYTEFDLKGNLVSFNQSTLDMSFRTKDELMNLGFKEYIESETAAEVYRTYNSVYRSGIPKKGFIHEIIRKDGTKITLECAISLKKINGKVVGFRGIWQDISARKKTEEDLANHRSRLEAIFGSVKEGIIALNAEGVVTDANRALETICCVPIDHLIGKRFVDIQTKCGKACHAILKEALSQEIEVKECQIGCDRKNRPQQVVVFNISPLINSNGCSSGAVLVLRDITNLLGMEKELRDRYKYQKLIGKSKRMQEIYELLENLANLETTILITGESGTGKELVAKALHYAGQRAKQPLVKVNCSALTESLLESELFGHVKGAFTGAIKDRQGRFQKADGGTILIDEIGDISPLIQLKLLRVLQEKEFERVGESTPCKVDVRVITSTNKDLKEKVRKGEFREDLYYRLKVMEIALPALRDRLEDLPLLVNHFCFLFRTRYKKKIEGVSTEVLGLFMKHAWPGNVRELEHILEHGFVLCNARTIQLEHLPAEFKEYSDTASVRIHSIPCKKKFTADDVIEALEKAFWNRTKAAHLLGVNRRTIHRKIRQFNLLSGK